MPVKKKKTNQQLAPPLPRNVTRYRKLNNTTSFVPSFYTEADHHPPASNTGLDDIITIVNEQDSSSSHE